ncbi:hypothetical protein DNHGIG_33000 [Collibacillus ludicampi]|uniref:CRISPR-associated endonuclease Cas2 n=1 Tax=Collibacillus ludicampi TaxID=2771369 RepID=A0AAV4LJ29_9BACL|nr:hypothetical protein DNHGIG_33000 [Collibacillus ludicampi]
MKDNTHRVQFGVFEAKLTSSSLISLRRRINKVLNPKEDSVISYSHCENCKDRVIRDGSSYSAFEDEDWYYI